VSEESAGLPAAWYTRPEIFARERRAIFAGAWQLLGRRDQLKNPGDYIAASLGGWSVFAMLDDEGSLGAFQNVCRHQGLPVLDAGAGTCETLRCRYHGWTYDRQGRFVKAPPPVAPADPVDPLHRLVRLGVTTIGGLILVRIDGDAMAVDPEIESALHGLSCVGDLGIDIDANWKVVIEHGLAVAVDERSRWSWPTLLVAPCPEGMIVYQTMPRAFRRTRLALHLFAAAPMAAAAMKEEAQRRANEAKTWCEAQQRTYESSDAATPTIPLLARFHARLREAHAAVAGASSAAI
jgi:nitrite reductase/ring-hydroxylating ferredoxin subunit